MWIVRPAITGDVPALVTLAEALGPGMTTFPADPDAIAAKVSNSERTFAGEVVDDPQYLLVLEDTANGALIGISGIYPRIGQPYGFFSYKVTRLVQRSDALGRTAEFDMLTLSNDYTGATEVGTLAIRPDYRGTGAARLLARARYMVIGAFPDRFASRVMAEMRGWQDEAGESPFWNAVGARFFDMPFTEADRLSAIAGNQFIADLMPRQPIYVRLLPAEAQAAIGRAHETSARAMKMLFDEDFRYEFHVDVFDAGPQVHIEAARIATIRNTVERPLAAGGGDTRLLVSNCSLADFRLAEVTGSLLPDSVQLDPGTAEALRLAAGEAARIAPAGRLAQV